MTDDEDRQLRLAVICGLIGVASVALQIGLSHPATRMWIAGAVHRVRTWYRADPHEGAIRQFANEVSRWDHEQSAQADRKPAAGGCGCGGQLPPVGHRRHPRPDAAGRHPVRVRDDRRRAGHLRARRPRHPHERRAGPWHGREGRAALESQ